MTLYSKDGSIPKPETDGTDGWVEVPEPPLPGPGEETVWWCPPGWVVRPVEPAPVEGGVWGWSQSDGKWLLYALSNTVTLVAAPALPALPSGNVTV